MSTERFRRNSFLFFLLMLIFINLNVDLIFLSLYNMIEFEYNHMFLNKEVT